MSYTKGMNDDTMDRTQLSRSESSYTNRSKTASSMTNSVLRFSDINFVVGKGDKRNNLLDNVSGQVKWGRKLRHKRFLPCSNQTWRISRFCFPVPGFRCTRRYGALWCRVSCTFCHHRRVSGMVYSCDSTQPIAHHSKTTLISALTLDAFYGKPHGSVTLNGVSLTDRIFKRHCYGKSLFFCWCLLSFST